MASERRMAAERGRGTGRRGRGPKYKRRRARHSFRLTRFGVAPRPAKSVLKAIAETEALLHLLVVENPLGMRRSSSTHAVVSSAAHFAVSCVSVRSRRDLMERVYGFGAVGPPLRRFRSRSAEIRVPQCANRSTARCDGRSGLNPAAEIASRSPNKPAAETVRRLAARSAQTQIQ